VLTHTYLGREKEGPIRKWSGPTFKGENCRVTKKKNEFSAPCQGKGERKKKRERSAVRKRGGGGERPELKMKKKTGKKRDQTLAPAEEKESKGKSIIAVHEKKREGERFPSREDLRGKKKTFPGNTTPSEKERRGTASR